MRAGGVQGGIPLRDDDPERRLAAIMAVHGRLLLHVAYQWSLCHDDALDAYQRGLEIFFKRADTVEPATEVAWLKVVIKHEALAIRRSRSESVSASDDDQDLDEFEPVGQRSLEEVVEGGERVSRSAEALRALKPDEAKALMLKAEGMSYAEIGERFGWTYTKVNRAITEGRKRFMKAYRAIETGEECERFAPVLAALARGEATSAQLVEIRPHLKHCTACKATLRELHVPARHRIRLFFPLAAAITARPDGIKTAEELIREDTLAATGSVPAPPTDAVAPHIIDIGGRLGLSIPEKPGRAGRAKDAALDWIHKTSSSDVAAGIHIASMGGGGRIATVASIIGFCVSGVGAGALCVATGVVKAPGWILPGDQARPAKPRAAAPKPTRPKAKVTASSRTTEVVATPTPVATPRPHRSPTRRAKPHRSPAKDPSQGTTRTSHESAPIAEPAQASVSEFSIEQSASSAPRQPDPAPATGGGEFAP